MTQPDQGLKARLDADDFGKSPFASKQEIALYDAWQSGQLITLSDHEAAVKAAVYAERDACANIAVKHAETARKKLGSAITRDDADVWSAIVTRCDMIYDTIRAIAPPDQSSALAAIEAAAEARGMRRAAELALQRKGDGTATLNHPYDKGYLAACDACASAILALIGEKK